ncbi:MAG: metallophosphoesterase [Oscillospiraceae bacterium]|nr:metallophosphoesterase [Oscillospiraceae bacterium]
MRQRRKGDGTAARRAGCALLLAALLVCTLAGCGAESAAKPPALEPLPAPEGLRIAVASDLHLDPDHTDKSTPSQVAYNLELVDALLWDARQQGAELLLLTGDLVNGGKPHRHEALAEKLRRAEETGLSVYVLPGNHDLAPIGQQEFAAYYAPFGYEEASSRDLASLSYCVKRDGLMLLMMDTGGYIAGAIDLPGAAPRGDNEAFLSEITLRWAEAMLREAREEGLFVLAAGHYNLLPEISRGSENSGYYLENGERFARLLREYGVPLYLSGHMHLRALYEEDGLTELLTEYLLAYPTGYSVLDLTDGALRYTPRRVDVDAWAAQTGQDDEVLLHYAAWQQQNLYDYSVENVAYMSQRNPLRKREMDRAADFFYAVMNAYWDGTLYERRAELEAMRGYEPFFRCAQGYAYGRCLKDLIASASPGLRGFTLHR